MPVISTAIKRNKTDVASMCGGFKMDIVAFFSDVDWITGGCQEWIVK